MLDIKFIRENTKLVKEAAKNKNIKVDIGELLKLDEEKREAQTKIDNLRAQRNELASAAKGGKPIAKQIAKGKNLKEEIAKLEREIENVNVKYTEILERVPNLHHPDAPIGKDDNDNKEVEIVGKPTKFNFEPKNHLELGKSLDLLDFETAAEVSGNGFYYLKNELALLEFALVQFVLEKLVKKGFIPFSTPDLARGFAMKGTGYNPRGNEDQIYEIKGEDLSLIATAEITLGSYLANKILAKKDLPIKYVGFSHCFRKEGGAYGKESRGLYRVHQFSKVEMFIFSAPEQSDDLLEEMKEIEKEIYGELKIPFRVLNICTGDLGAPAYRKYDLEAWLPMKNNWGEITSCSNCTDFQSRRLNIKYKDNDGKTKLVHTLNGTAMAFTRVPIAILENFQQADGSVKIPKVLKKYMPSLVITPK
ncbi:serine--tRNA ligase [Candidatus Falkowbacteria bacterium CG10_big_fil_rev_8_21_14_0_10_43_10]|uniref:Serine--tRNA ligase n=1 Tax=Candidatus Falkowbacteria bacterium CG10_big_fil_rev_8_21_14_0_10_43_10 TaxID=1974567 RepID=A0A2H0V1R6_9BACT|nr:MAG: serine--tRNA ligase [Candidatus Falkowbacteria bacterium CG10_big_fil_rev_8_21_14_0_10_43_10]